MDKHMLFEFFYIVFRFDLLYRYHIICLVLCILVRFERPMMPYKWCYLPTGPYVRKGQINKSIWQPEFPYGVSNYMYTTFMDIIGLTTNRKPWPQEVIQASLLFGIFVFHVVLQFYPVVQNFYIFVYILKLL